jgi:NADPH:quinone reductase-like Zn-dependent oxidoreductase
MKALVLEKADGPGAAVLRDEPVPRPKAGEVRVAIKAASLNHRELWISRGQYPGMKLPCILGADGAGVIDEVGEGVAHAEIGREVLLYPALNWGSDRRFPSASFGLLGMPGPGTIAEWLCVPAENAFAKPAHLSFEEAAALPTAGITAWRALVGKARIQPGEKVLITGIGGGVATFAMKFALAHGARVYVTSSSAASLAKAAELGAAGGFNYKEDGWRKTLAQASGGVDVVIDGAPAGAFAGYARTLAMGARVVVYGSTGGPQFQLSAPDLFLRHAFLIGTAMGDLVDFRAMLAFTVEKRLRPVIDRSFKLTEAPEALQYLEKSHQFGKVTITM